MEEELVRRLCYIFGPEEGTKKAQMLQGSEKDTKSKILAELLSYIVERNELEEERMRLMEDLDNEYKREGNAFGEKISMLGLDANSLSPHAHAGLKVITEVADMLDLDDVSEPAIMMGISRKTSEFKDLERDLDEKGDILRVMTEKINDGVDRLNIAKDTLRKNQENMELEMPETSVEESKLGFLELKWNEYEDFLAQMDEMLHESGYNPSITYQSLDSKREELEQVLAESEKLEKKLQVYKDLPPDLELANKALFGKRKELRELEEKLSEKLEKIDFTGLDSIS